MAFETDFNYSTEKEPHRIRTKQILQAHPEVRNLIGKEPKTIAVIVLAVSIQLITAFFLRDQPWWMIVTAAYLIGAFADHVLFVCIHEVAHHLLFKSKAANMFSGILANIPSFLPSAVSFQKYHIKHHSFQGVQELDGDLPSDWEAKWVGGSFIKKSIWMLFYPVFQILRTFRLKEIFPIDRWVVINILVQVVFNIAFWVLVGPKAIAYLVISFFFSVGLHPLGGRWVQEHYLVDSYKDQETFSYYGPLNVINLNVGFHNEHHDFPSIPWSNIKKLKSAAPEFYDHLAYHTSYTKLWIKFLTDPHISLYSRVIRKERGRVPLNDHSIPDVQMIEDQKSALV